MWLSYDVPCTLAFPVLTSSYSYTLKWEKHGCWIMILLLWNILVQPSSQWQQLNTIIIMDFCTVRSNSIGNHLLMHFKNNLSQYLKTAMWFRHLYYKEAVIFSVHWYWYYMFLLLVSVIFVFLFKIACAVLTALQYSITLPIAFFSCAQITFLISV
jgi:hypothetical protein